MNFERITCPHHPMYSDALRLYHTSFPVHEQRESDSQIHILEDEEYHFNLILNEKRFLGLMLSWETINFIYVEHFCILPELRGHGYGKTALQLICREGKRIILEIDPPVNQIAVRRKNFYERCGFLANAYRHVHPAYHNGSPGHELVIMSWSGQITKAEYDEFNQYLNRRVMAEAF